MNSTSISTVQSSPTIGKLTEALQAFQQKCPKIPKSSRNPFLNSRYADLATILDIIKEPLLEAKLTVMQMPVGEYGLTTILSHTSGEWISSNYIMQPLESIIDKSTKEKAITPQSLGSVITYQRRYAIGAILCLNIDDDNDGNPTNGQVDNSTPAAPPKKTAQQILEEARAAKNQQEEPAPKVDATVAPKDAISQQTREKMNQPPLVETPSPLLTNDVPSTEEQVALIKSLIDEWEQTRPGVSKEFVQLLHATGRKFIRELSYLEADKLVSSVKSRSLSSFFDQSLSRSAAA